MSGAFRLWPFRFSVRHADSVHEPLRKGFAFRNLGDFDELVRLVGLVGIDTLTVALGRKAPDLGSGCEATLLSDGKRLGPKRFEEAAWHEMALDIEGVLDGSVDCQEALGRSRRFEPLLFSFSSSNRLV
jgi:hypothetical protein